MQSHQHELWTQSMLAEHLGISQRTLERARVVGDGVPFVRVGRLVRYRQSDIDAWVASRIRRSTSEPDTKGA